MFNVNKTFEKIKKQLSDFYEIDISYNDYIAMTKISGKNCRKIENSTYAIRVFVDNQEIFIAINKRGSFIYNVLPRKYLFDHFFSSILFMTSYAHSAFNTCKNEAKKLGIDLTYDKWVSLNKKVLSNEYVELVCDNCPASTKLVHIYGNTVPMLWDEELTLLVGVEYPLQVAWAEPIQRLAA